MYYTTHGHLGLQFGAMTNNVAMKILVHFPDTMYMHFCGVYI